MKPEFFQIKRGCYKIGINSFFCGLTKKPVIRIECVTDNTIGQNLDGEWDEEYECAMFTFRTIEDYDSFVQKLQEAREYLISQPENTKQK